MKKYSSIIGFFLVIITTGCQTEGQKAYADLLKEGTVLTKNDTSLVEVGDKLLYLYSFSAGVEPIYYTLKHYNSDSTILKYVEDQQFYVGDEDMSGGPSEGAHIFEAAGAGLVRLEFYNPYYNAMEYRKVYPEHNSSDRVIMEFYKTYTDSVALNDWTDAQYANYYDNWTKLPERAKDEVLDTLLAKFQRVSVTTDTATKTKIIRSFAKRYALRASEITNMMLDTLFNMPQVDGMERWQMILKERKKNLPLHKNLETTVLYVKIED